MPTETAKPLSRYKGFYRLEEQARQQLLELVAGCRPEYEIIPAPVRGRVSEQLRPVAQRAILNALEGRTAAAEEQFGYDWAEVLPRLQPDPLRQAAGQFLCQQLPHAVREALASPALTRRDKIEWLYHETVDRIRRFTPYLPSEQRELAEWKRHCPAAYSLAEKTCLQLVRAGADRIRKAAVTTSERSADTQRLATIGSLIAARKLYQHVLNLAEYYDGPATAVALKVPPELQGRWGPRLYVRFGISDTPAAYREASAAEIEQFRRFLESPLLRNLQEKVSPWTTETAAAQKIDANLLARVYFQIVQPDTSHNSPARPHVETLRELQNNHRHYRLLGFREDIAPEDSRIFEELLDSNQGLRDFLDQPSVLAVFQAHRIDTGMVEAAVRATVVEEMLRVTKLWRPEEITIGKDPASSARELIPKITGDLAAYHDALMRSDYLAVHRANFFKERLLAEHLVCVTPRERQRIESYSRPMAVVLVARDDGSTEPAPSEWRLVRSYLDPVTHKDYSDYHIESPEGRIVLCLRRGAKPLAALDQARKLLDLEQPAHVNDSASRLKGVRISELSYNELSASCLRPISMARMQFYTSFSPSRTLEILRGSSDEPTTENIIEALRPCFVLRYSDAYCRVKPAEMIRVKYRTPTGEKKNPCWDASQTLGGLRNAASDPNMRDRLENPKWGLIIIEGEKKAALLAQMCLERNLPYHVMALPGVWMGLSRGKLVEELAQFRMRDSAGQRRHCYIFFDNDKAFKAGVMHALIETAGALHRAGAEVFVPNLPFGKKVKGTDDYAMVHCRRGGDLDYQPLVEILENAVHVPERPRKVKYPSPEQERDINRKLAEAEQVCELQDLLRQKEAPLDMPELRQLFLLQSPYLFKSGNERQSAAVWDSLNERGRQSLLPSLLSSNPAMKLLRQACGGIPSFEEGPTARELIQGTPALSGPPVLVPELFAVS